VCANCNLQLQHNLIISLSVMWTQKSAWTQVTQCSNVVVQFSLRSCYGWSHLSITFLPRDAMHKRGLCSHAVSVRLSVRHVRGSRQNELLSIEHWVTWVHADFCVHITDKLIISSKIFHHRVATPFYFFRPKGGADIPTGTPLTGVSNARGYEKSRFSTIIFTNISLYLRNGYS